MPKSNTDFEIGQAVMVTNHTHHTFKPKYLIDYRVLKILNESTLLLVTPTGREHKTKINDVKPCTILELIENVWKTFPNSIKRRHQNHDYNLRPCDELQHLHHDQYSYHQPTYSYQVPTVVIRS